MAANSKISWCRHSFNPWVGCTKISGACHFCYAEGWAKRTGQAHLWAGDRRRTSSANWHQVHRWNFLAAAASERHRVFCASLADVFDNQVPTRWRDDLWHLIDQTPDLDWLLLTKRPQNIAKMLPDTRTGVKAWGQGWPNVWLGTTIENQQEADRRIPYLLDVPARIRFLSCEPLLAPVDLTEWLVCPKARDGLIMDPSTGAYECCGACDWTGVLGGIDWVITGGESGPNARPSNPQWFRDIRDQCAAAGVAFHHKQNGEWVSVSEVEGAGRHHSFDDGRTVRRVGTAKSGRTLDGVVHDQFPEVAR